MTADFVRASTSIMIRRWDADQAGWVRQRAAREYSLGRLLGGWEPQAPDFEHFGVRPYSVTEDHDCNLIVQTGWVVLLGGVAGTTMATKFSATQARIGVGTSSTAASWSQTGLVGDTGGGSTTSYFQLVTVAPAIATGSSPVTLTFTASFAGGNANFAWNEFGTDNANASGVTGTGFGGNYVFFNRGVSAQGTKPVGQIWAMTETIQFGFPSGSGTVT